MKEKSISMIQWLNSLWTEREKVILLFQIHVLKFNSEVSTETTSTPTATNKQTRTQIIGVKQTKNVNCMLIRNHRTLGVYIVRSEFWEIWNRLAVFRLSTFLTRSWTVEWSAMRFPHCSNSSSTIEAEEVERTTMTANKIDRLREFLFTYTMF